MTKFIKENYKEIFVYGLFLVSTIIFLQGLFVGNKPKESFPFGEHLNQTTESTLNEIELYNKIIKSNIRKEF